MIDGIPILLKEPRRYLHRLSGFLATQLEKLQQFCEYPGDRLWAEPQSKRVVPECTVEMIGPVPYKEHCAHSRTVTYDTILITAGCKA